MRNNFMPMKHVRSELAQSRERRRLEAGKMFEKGKSQIEVARHFVVSRTAAHVWYKRWKKNGEKGLLAKGRSGRPPKLSKKQLEKVERALEKGPKAYGWATDLWTLPRIAKVIKKTTNTSYHPGHVWKILQELGWSSQKPETKARERDEEKIKRWVRKDFPRIQKKGSK